jgi:hypothetical protein
MLEGDAKAIGALVTAHAGEDFKFMVGIGKEAFGAFDAHALGFLARGAAHVFEEGLVQPPVGHGGDPDEILDADGLADVLPDKPEAVGNAFVLDRKEVAAIVWRRSLSHCR